MSTTIEQPTKAPLAPPTPQGNPITEDEIGRFMARLTNEWREPQCEVQHPPEGKYATCLRTVTVRLTFCEGSVLGCDVARSYWSESMQPPYCCVRCKRAILECWRISPV